MILKNPNIRIDNPKTKNTPANSIPTAATGTKEVKSEPSISNLIAQIRTPVKAKTKALQSQPAPKIPSI